MDNSFSSKAAELVHGDRQDAYGEPIDDFTKITGMINAAFAHKLKEPFTAEDWPLIMIMVKMSRQVNKSSDDNIIDIHGYANTLEMVMNERKARQAPPLNHNQMIDNGSAG